MQNLDSKIFTEFNAFPESVKAHFELNKVLLVDDGPLSKQDREYLAFKTSEINKNPYGMIYHKKAFEEAKTSEPKKILEEMAVTLTKEPTQSSWLKGRFIAEGYSEAQWQHAVNVIAYTNFTNRLAFAANIYQQYP